MWLRLLLVGLSLAAAASAVEPLYQVDAEVLFLPQSGVALDAHAGGVLWRFPRYDGQTYTDGRGLLLVSWTARIQPEYHRRFTRICRLRTSDGSTLWCHDWAGVQQWTVDAGGGVWYLETPGRIEVHNVADGRSKRSFRLRWSGDPALMPLPKQGVLALDRDGPAGHAAALVYRPGDTALSAETLPAPIYAFHGGGRSGLLLYAREQGEFYLAAPLTALFRSSQPPKSAADPFPEVSLDGHGFVIVDGQDPAPMVRGGTYDGRRWEVPLQLPGGARFQPMPPRLALAAATAILIEADPQSDSAWLIGWSRDSGEPRFSETLAGNFSVAGAVDDAVVVQSESAIRLVDADSGAERWRAARHEGPLAAISPTAVVFWEDAGVLAALARNNGNLLWRIRLALPGRR